MSEIIDITVPFRTDLPLWPGDPRPQLSLMKSVEGGYRCNVTRIDTGVHFGTHLDAPCHFVEGGKSVEQLDLDVLVGPCFVGHVPDTAAITPAHLESLDIPDGTERLLLKTSNSELWSKPDHAFFEDFAALTPDAAKWVVDNGIRLIGIDYLSIQRFSDNVSTTHIVLLDAEVIIVEGLDLRNVEGGVYDLTCLPMKISGADGAPVRALLRLPEATDAER
ncbi:MAG: cyclase family protein [Alphaproteobacteria bacterium]